MKKQLAILLALALLTCAALAEEDVSAAAPSPDLYSGTWVCDRASIEMDWEEEGWRVLIRWGSSAWEHSEWEYSCFLNSEDGTLVSMPFGTRTDFVYNDDGEIVSADVKYEDGAAVFSLDADGFLLWADEKENAGENMRFEKLSDLPRFDTLGQAMTEAEYSNVFAGYADRCVIAVEVDGRYYRVTAETSAAVLEAEKAITSTEPGDLEAAFAAYQEAVKALPVTGVEEITAEALGQAELDALAGRSLAELTNEGWEITGSGYGGENDPVIFDMTFGLFEYSMVMNESPQTYDACGETGDYGSLTVQSAAFERLSGRAADLSYRVDGTWEPQEDAWDVFNSLSRAVTEAMNAAAANGEVDAEALISELGKVFPGQEELIRTLVEAAMLVQQLIPQ